MEAGKPEAEETKGAFDELVAGEEPAGEAVEGGGVFDGFFDAELSREGGEVAVADFDGEGAGGEATGGELLRKLGGLLAEAGAEDGPVRGIALKSVFAADAFDFIAKVKGAVVFAMGHAFEVAAP